MPEYQYRLSVVSGNFKIQHMASDDGTLWGEGNIPLETNAEAMINNYVAWYDLRNVKHTIVNWISPKRVTIVDSGIENAETYMLEIYNISDRCYMHIYNKEEKKRLDTITITITEENTNDFKSDNELQISKDIINLLSQARTVAKGKRKGAKQVAETFYLCIKYEMGCFPNNAIVTTLDGPRKCSELRIGDKVHVGDNRYEAIRMFSHFDTNAKSPFVQVTLSNGKTVTATSGHLIRVENDIKTFGELIVGEKLLYKNKPRSIRRIDSWRETPIQE